MTEEEKKELESINSFYGTEYVGFVWNEQPKNKAEKLLNMTAHLKDRVYQYKCYLRQVERKLWFGEKASDFDIKFLSVFSKAINTYKENIQKIATKNESL